MTIPDIKGGVQNSSKTIIEPRILRMSPKELDNRIEYLRTYMRSISPKVSIYASLERERKMCRARLTDILSHHG